MRLTFNVNDNVRVRLTDVGRAALRKNHDELFADWIKPPEFVLRKEDERGWSEWHLWDLMHEFGRHMYNGCQVPFETEIELVG